ncbi:hypothetical protein HJ044_05040 [Vibrio parahaemolyticus]|nr:hypothetical protein [Vibrio parahaemolyticus]
MNEQITRLDELLQKQEDEQKKFEQEQEQAKQQHEQKQRERDAEIAELQKAMKYNALRGFQVECKKLNITPQDIAKFFGIKVAKEDEPKKAKNQRKPTDVILQIEHEGVLKQLRGTSMKALEKEPWRSFIIDGTINQYSTTHKLGEGVDAQYWTQAMIDAGVVVPDDADKIERKNGGPIKDIEGKRKYLEEAK